MVHIDSLEHGGSARLSPREAAVTRCVVTGDSPDVIARKLGITLKTTTDYIFRLCQGLRLRNKVELVVWGVQNPRAIDASDEKRAPARTGLHKPGCRCGTLPCAIRRLETAAA
jgi:DNA-binding CsgD family transcriptional regulator